MKKQILQKTEDHQKTDSMEKKICSTATVVTHNQTTKSIIVYTNTNTTTCSIKNNITKLDQFLSPFF